ncbi:DUF5134 domain-containing protein [Actinophytocola sp.]|uniref:DUF5134 domain-containing protein n=1 Tax=Actinophytocola sp. TaxID=1872138 RepID=UPI003D6ACEB7
MSIPGPVAWCLLGLFLLLAVAVVIRLGHHEQAASTSAVRQSDVAEFLLLLAMAASVSPVGAPIPRAGWQTVLLLVTSWFAVAATRPRSPAGMSRLTELHHVVSAVAMFYMATVMPHGGSVHGHPAAPLLAVAMATYFGIDGIRSMVVAVRTERRWPNLVVVPRLRRLSRPACRAVMSLGMAYMSAIAL